MTIENSKLAPKNAVSQTSSPQSAISTCAPLQQLQLQQHCHRLSLHESCLFAFGLFSQASHGLLYVRHYFYGQTVKSVESGCPPSLAHPIPCSPNATSIVWRDDRRPVMVAEAAVGSGGGSSRGHGSCYLLHRYC